MRHLAGRRVKSRRERTATRFKPGSAQTHEVWAHAGLELRLILIEKRCYVLTLKSVKLMAVTGQPGKALSENFCCCLEFSNGQHDFFDLLNMTAVLSPIFSNIQHIGMQNMQNMIFSQSAIMATVESLHEGLEYSMARAMGP